MAPRIVVDRLFQLYEDQSITFSEFVVTLVALAREEDVLQSELRYRPVCCDGLGSDWVIVHH